MLHVVIPMAGLGSRFSSRNFKKHKYLLPLDLKLTTMLEYAVCSLGIQCNYIFIMRDDYSDIVHEICKKHNLEYKILFTDGLTDGPASTALLASVHEDDEVIISNSDQVLFWNHNDFLEKSRKYDGCVLTYKPDYDLIIGQKDKNSFVKLDENEDVIECREKIVLSEKALVGVHYIKRWKDFVIAYEYAKNNNIRASNGELYISSIFQAMIENNKSIGYHDLSENEKYHAVGEPDDYFEWLYTLGGYVHDVRREELIYEDDVISIHYLKNYTGTIKNEGFILHGDTITSFSTVSFEIPEDIITIRYDHKGLTEKNWNSKDFIRGWFIGHFKESIIQTDHLEVGRLKHEKGHIHQNHYHSEATEINVLLKGSMSINNRKIIQGDVFTLHKNQIVCPIFDEDCELLCVKVPSIKNDKYIV